MPKIQWMSRDKNHFGKEEQKKIKNKLKKCLGPEFVVDRTGAGNMQMTYIQGGMIVNLANHVFGFNGWSNRIKHFTQEYSEKTADGRLSLGVSCCCRVTLKDGTYREDVGFGCVENQRQLGIAIQTAKKKAATDALKRTLRLFGNALGNCLYDKGYLKSIHALPKKTATCFNAKDLLTNEDFQDSPMNFNDISLGSNSFEFNNSGSEL